MRITSSLLLFVPVLVTAGAWGHVVNERQPRAPVEKYAAATRGDCWGLEPCYGCFKQLDYDPTGSGRLFRVSYLLTPRIRTTQGIRLCRDCAAREDEPLRRRVLDNWTEVQVGWMASVRQKGHISRVTERQRDELFRQCYLIDEDAGLL